MLSADCSGATPLIWSLLLSGFVCRLLDRFLRRLLRRRFFNRRLLGGQLLHQRCRPQRPRPDSNILRIDQRPFRIGQRDRRTGCVLTRPDASHALRQKLTAYGLRVSISAEGCHGIYGKVGRGPEGRPGARRGNDVGSRTEEPVGGKYQKTFHGARRRVIDIAAWILACMSSVSRTGHSVTLLLPSHAFDFVEGA